MPKHIDVYIARLQNGELLTEKEIEQVCSLFKDIAVDESNVVHLVAPVTVVGDVHGQFYDLLEAFHIGGPCPYTNYLFLGDYVDRGLHSVETISLLLCLKIRYPSRIHLLRGNHETRKISQVYGFYKECVEKYDSPRVWFMISDVFDYFALAATINDSIYCVHGGLSPSLMYIDQIHILDRFQEMPEIGPITDMLWSDPETDGQTDYFVPSKRGAGYRFGAEVVKRFLYVNKMSHILRAHQLCMNGYNVVFNDLLTTVWSAPNYCYRMRNSASILQVGFNLERDPNCFEASPETRKLEHKAPMLKTTKMYF